MLRSFRVYQKFIYIQIEDKINKINCLFAEKSIFYGIFYGVELAVNEFHAHRPDD